jgi:hypothetical protein
VPRSVYRLKVPPDCKQRRVSCSVSRGKGAQKCLQSSGYPAETVQRKGSPEVSYERVSTREIRYPRLSPAVSMYKVKNASECLWCYRVNWCPGPQSLGSPGAFTELVVSRNFTG